MTKCCLLGCNATQSDEIQLMFWWNISSIFSVEEKAKQETSVKATGKQNIQLARILNC
jgi:hypothetical protein